MITFIYLFVLTLSYGLIGFIDTWLYHVPIWNTITSHYSEMNTGMWFPIGANFLTLVYTISKDFSNWKKRRRPAGGNEAGDNYEANA